MATLIQGAKRVKTLKLIPNVTIHFKPRHLHKALLDPRLDSLPLMRDLISKSTMCTARFRQSENSRTKLDEIFCSAAQRKINRSILTVAIDAPGKTSLVPRMTTTPTKESDNRLTGRKRLITITVRDCYGKCGDKGESERATYAMI